MKFGVYSALSGKRIDLDAQTEEFKGLAESEVFSPGRIQLAIILFFVSLLFLAVDVVLPSMFRDESGLLALNLVVAQLTLICIWGTLVEGTFWVRTPWTLLLLVISWGAIAWGILIERGGNVSPATVLGLGLVWFYGFIVSFIPLKIAAWCFGWRITHQRGSNNDSANRYAIRDLMIGTGMLAVTLAIGKAMVQGDMPTWKNVLRQSGLDDPEMFFVIGIFSVVSLVVKLPCIWIALASKERILGASIAWVMISGVMGLVEFVMLCAVIGSPGDGMEIVFYLSLGHMCMASSMLLVLWLLRCYGYGMHRRAKWASRRESNELTNTVDS